MTASSDPTTAPDALLLIATGCPHCRAVLQALSELVKTGYIGKLEVVNIANRPERAQLLGVRSVPWLRLGPFELTGLRSQAELQHWAEQAHTTEGMADYISELLSSGNLKKVIALLSRQAEHFEALFLLLSNPDTGLHIQLGIGAVMEEFQGSETLKHLVEPLAELTLSADARLRSDACHFLSLTRAPEAIPHIQRLFEDSHPEVREVAEESLAELMRSA